MSALQTATRHVVEVRGCETSVVRYGAGAPVLLLHGFEPFAADAPFVAALARRADVIAPDHPGFGDSASPPWLDQLADLVYFYREFLAALGVDRAHVVGHGLGGWIGLELALRTDVVRSLTLIDAAGVVAPEIDGIDTFLCTAEQLHRAQFADGALAEATLPPSSERTVELQLKNGLTTALLGWQPRFHDPHLRKWLHQITAPTMVLWGAEDRIFPLAYGRELQAAIRGARLRTFDGAGHALPTERPADVADAIGAFIQEVDR